MKEREVRESFDKPHIPVQYLPKPSRDKYYSLREDAKAKRKQEIEQSLAE